MQEKEIGKKIILYINKALSVEIPSGTFYEGLNKETKKKVLVQNLQTNKNYINQEILILKGITHENIMRIFEFYETKTNYYVAMEHCTSTLEELIISSNGLDEDLTYKYFIQTITGFQELSKYEMIPKYFTTENLFFDKGFFFTRYEAYEELFDSLHLFAYHFMAPELIENKEKSLRKELTLENSYATPLIKKRNTIHVNEGFAKMNIWTLGVLLFRMLFGKNVKQLIENIKTNEKNLKNIILSNAKNKNLSDSTIDYLTKCLKVDPYKRIPWEDLFKKVLMDKILKINETVSVEVTNNNLNFQEKINMKEKKDSVMFSPMIGKNTLNFGELTDMIQNLNQPASSYKRHHSELFSPLTVNPKPLINKKKESLFKNLSIDEKEESQLTSDYNKKKNYLDIDQPDLNEENEEDEEEIETIISSQSKLNEEFLKPFDHEKQLLQFFLDTYENLQEIHQEYEDIETKLTEFALLKFVMNRLYNNKISLQKNMNIFNFPNPEHFFSSFEYKSILLYLEGELNKKHADFLNAYGYVIEGVINKNNAYDKELVKFINDKFTEPFERIKIPFRMCIYDTAQLIRKNSEKLKKKNEFKSKELLFVAHNLICCMVANRLFVYNPKNENAFLDNNMSILDFKEEIFQKSFDEINKNIDVLLKRYFK